MTVGSKNCNTGSVDRMSLILAKALCVVEFHSKFISALVNSHKGVDIEAMFGMCGAKKLIKPSKTYRLCLVVQVYL